MTEPQQPTPDGVTPPEGSAPPPPPDPAGGWETPPPPQPGAWQQPAPPPSGAWPQPNAAQDGVQPGAPQPGWQQPSPSQPGWGQPSAQGPWGQPGAPGWGPAPGQPAWPPTAPARRSRKPWVIGCLVLIALLLVGVGSCTVFFVRSFGVAGTVLANSNGEIDGFHANTYNGRTSIVFTAARGVDEAEGTRIACTVIVPAMRNAGAEDDWALVNRAGDVIASKSTTSCP